jgi:hypothetical protein
MIIWSSKVRFKESQNSGVEFGLVYKPGSNTDIFVMFVTSFLVQTATKDIQRGTIFTVSTEPNLPQVITNLYWQMIALL